MNCTDETILAEGDDGGHRQPSSAAAKVGSKGRA